MLQLLLDFLTTHPIPHRQWQETTTTSTEISTLQASRTRSSLLHRRSPRTTLVWMSLPVQPSLPTSPPQVQADLASSQPPHRLQEGPRAASFQQQVVAHRLRRPREVVSFLLPLPIWEQARRCPSHSRVFISKSSNIANSSLHSNNSHSRTACHSLWALVKPRRRMMGEYSGISTRMRRVASYPFESFLSSILHRFSVTTLSLMYHRRLYALLACSLLLAFLLASCFPFHRLAYMLYRPLALPRIALFFHLYSSLLDPPSGLSFLRCSLNMFYSIARCSSVD